MKNNTRTIIKLHSKAAYTWSNEKVMPVIARLRKLQYEYTKDIDMADVNKIRSGIVT
jgi:hypothetical protein